MDRQGSDFLMVCQQVRDMLKQKLQSRQLVKKMISSVCGFENKLCMND
jgi:hypothetical protein